MNIASKEILFDVITERVVSKIITLIPFLGWPIINQIVSKSIAKLIILSYETMHEMKVIAEIDFRGETQKKQYEEATDKLERALEEPINLEEIKRAKDEYKKKLRDLIMLNAS